MQKPFVRHLLAAGLAAAALLIFSSCDTPSTKVTDSWVAADITQLHFTKVLALAAIETEGVRRVFEDAIVQSMPNVRAIPSYQFILKPEDLKDGSKVSGEMKAAGFDGVVVLRLLGDRTEQNVTHTTDYAMGYGYPGGYGYGMGAYPYGYRNFGGYYNNYAMPAYTTTTVTNDRIISVEINIYEFPGEKLVWSGIAESKSPGDIPDLLNGVAAAVRKEMSKQKLIAPPAH
jgi:hypothetical protein